MTCGDPSTRSSNSLAQGDMQRRFRFRFKSRFLQDAQVFAPTHPWLPLGFACGWSAPVAAPVFHHKEHEAHEGSHKGDSQVHTVCDLRAKLANFSLLTDLKLMLCGFLCDLCVLCGSTNGVRCPQFDPTSPWPLTLPPTDCLRSPVLDADEGSPLQSI